MPASIAPFTVVITPVNFAEPSQREAARRCIASAGRRASIRCSTTATSALA